MSPEDANERLRAICLEAMDIATEQGWDWTLDARPKRRPGWQFTVYTDRVDEQRLRRNRDKQLSLEEATR